VEVEEEDVEMPHQILMLKVVAAVLVLFTQRIQQSQHHKENPQSQSRLRLILSLLEMVVQVPLVK
tara:strand:- start:403 stop:597 length:195 start_codon:yes stop_codon:yes gene_type:complete